MRGLFACVIDRIGQSPKQTFVLDLVQLAEAQQLSRARGVMLEEGAILVFQRTLPNDLRERLREKNLGLDYRTLPAAVAKGGRHDVH